MALVLFFLMSNACQPQPQQQEQELFIGKLGAHGGLLATPLLPNGETMEVPEFVNWVRTNRPNAYKKHQVQLERLLDRYYLQEVVKVLFANSPPNVTVKSVLEKLKLEDAESFERNLMFFEFLIELKENFIRTGVPRELPGMNRA